VTSPLDGRSWSHGICRLLGAQDEKRTWQTNRKTGKLGPRNLFPELLFLSFFPRPTSHPRLTPLPWWHPAALIATVFGVGRLRPAPGTWGSLAALPAAWAISSAAGGLALAVAVIIVSVFGVWASDIYVRRTGADDPSVIVIDEVAGQWLTLVLLPTEPLAYAMGFLLFRVFDVLKPWPASWADRRIKGGLGVMLDDLLAGIMAGAVAWLLWDWLTVWRMS